MTLLQEKRGSETPSSIEAMVAELQHIDKQEAFSRQVELTRDAQTKVIKLIEESKPFEEVLDFVQTSLTNVALYDLYMHESEITNNAIELEVNRLRKGFLTEVATHLAFKQAGFKIISPTVTEDLQGGIDLYVIPQDQLDQGDVWAIQIKSREYYEAIVVEDIKSGAKSDDEIRKVPAELFEQGESSVKDMLNYLSGSGAAAYKAHTEFIDHGIRPMTIYIPCGEERPYKKTGEPMSQMSTQLVKAANEAIRRSRVR